MTLQRGIQPSELVWVGRGGSDSIEHIARHGIRPSEVEQVAIAPLQIRRGSKRRYRLIGQTHGGRFITVFLERARIRRWFVVSARDANETERNAASGRK